MTSNPQPYGESLPGRTLVLGATGTTGSRVATALRAARHQILPASRTEAHGYTEFDWLNSDTWPAVLGTFDALYLVAPIGVAEPRPVVEPFLTAAVDAGLRRTVLLSSSAVEPGESGLGALQQLVIDVSPEWAVLRPSWFMQNFTGDLAPAQGIREGAIVTATRGGRIGFIDADDIAAVAATLLTQKQAPQDDFILTGPQALSFAEVCAIASDILGRPIRTTDVTPEAFVDHLTQSGVPREFASVLAELDRAIAQGAEDRTTDTVADILGRPGRDMRSYLAYALPSSAR